MKEQFNTMEFYRNKVAKSIFFISIGAILSAIVACVMCIINKLFLSTPTYLFGVFIGIGMVEIIGFILVYRTVFQNKEISDKQYSILKNAVTIICILNYTFLIYLMPSQTLWASFLFFLMIMGLFQDFRLTRNVIVIYVIIVISFFITHSIETLQQVPASDELIVRIQLVCLGVLGGLLASYFSGHILADVGQDLMNENTNQLTEIIRNVAILIGKLQDTTSTLVAVSQEENASMEEITSTSLSIVADNNDMIDKSESSRRYLNTLEEGIKNISGEMSATRDISNSLLEMSKDNEMALKHILEICSTIDESTNHTLAVTQALQNKAEEINGLLKLIENIAEETNLLALNASIEAARAGEEGRGFAVVAEQVKRLSENTARSLKDVNKVIDEFKADTKQVEELMEKNVEQVQKQNVVTHETVETISKMLIKLRDSAQKIDDVDQLTQSQNIYTKEAVIFNEEIVSNMKEQLGRVESISKLVDENRQAIEQIVIEVDGLNEVVEEINKVLEK